MVIVAVNGSKDLCFSCAFYFFFFFFFEGDLVVSYLFLFQNIYFSDNAPLINIFIKSIIENILQFLISNLLFSLQKYYLILLQILQKFKRTFMTCYLFYYILNMIEAMSNATNHNFILNNVKGIQVS